MFEPIYKWREQWGYQTDLVIFNPSQLDTDQWIKSVKEAGEKYATLVDKHCSGFSLWPAKAHNYSVKNTSWRNGKEDIATRKRWT